MKKTLVAIAALAATSAFAQSSVTVYGIVDMGYAHSKDNNNGRETSGARGGNQSGNRLGFKGTEDIGGGLKANFVFETGFDPTGNQTNLLGYRETAAGHVESNSGTVTTATNRQSWVGLAGGFGEARYGYQYSVDYTISSLSGIQATTEGVRGGNLHLSTILAARATGVAYFAPKFNNIQLVGFYGSAIDETAGVETRTVDSAASNVGAIYANGPLVAAASLGNLKQARTDITSQRTDNSSMILGASYDLGMVKLGATYGTRDSQAVADGVKTELVHQQFSVAYPMGKTVLLASMGSKSTKNAAGTKTVDIDAYQLGANYNFSKRTNAYAYYGQDKDSVKASTAQGHKVSTAVVGIRHQF